MKLNSQKYSILQTSEYLLSITLSYVCKTHRISMIKLRPRSILSLDQAICTLTNLMENDHALNNA